MANNIRLLKTGKNIMINRTFKSSPDYNPPSRFRVGIDQASVTEDSAALTQQIPISGTEAVDSCDDESTWTADTDTAKADNTTTYVEGTGSISIAKTGTAGTAFGIHKTVTSRDFTSKELWVWLRLTDITDLVASGTAVTIRYGSDSSNYYYLDVNISSLSNGANWINFNSGNATGTTGAPVIGSCDYFKIILNTDLAADTIAADRILLDDIKVASAGDYYKNQQTVDAVTYPTVNETTQQWTQRGILIVTDAVGYLVDGLVFETDNSVSFSMAKLPGDSKGSNDEFIYIETGRFL